MLTFLQRLQLQPEASFRPHLLASLLCFKLTCLLSSLFILVDTWFSGSWSQGFSLTKVIQIGPLDIKHLDFGSIHLQRNVFQVGKKSCSVLKLFKDEGTAWLRVIKGPEILLTMPPHSTASKSALETRLILVWKPLSSPNAWNIHLFSLWPALRVKMLN